MAENLLVEVMIDSYCMYVYGVRFNWFLGVHDSVWKRHSMPRFDYILFGLRMGLFSVSQAHT